MALACPADVAAANAISLDNGRTVAEEIEGLSAVIGEKLELGNVANFAGSTTVYLHRRSEDLPPQVGVLVEYTGDETVARATAMQIAAMSPVYPTMEDVPAEVYEAKKVGIIILGGGVPKHFALFANTFREGVDLAVQITMDRPEPGGLSGASLEEAISWGKVKAEAKHVKIYGDATIIFPIVALASFK